MNHLKAALTVACFLISAMTAWAAAEVGDKVPSFEASTLDGQRIHSEDLSGRHQLLLVFWSTWCPFCESAIPQLNEIHDRYAASSLVFLAVNPGVRDSLRKIERYRDKYSMNYPIVFDEGAVIAKNFAVRGVPTVIIADRRGVIRYRNTGIHNDLAARVEAVLKQDAADAEAAGR
jgi:peroxiredoxin